MKLLVFRHGIAEDHGPDGTDASRRLTDEGVARARSAALGLAVIAEAPEVILTSPKVRAVQTAEAAREVFDAKMVVEETLGEGTARAIVALLSRRLESRVMIAGHEPALSGVVERLCTGTEGGFVPLKKAGCACVDVDFGHAPPAASLLWLATPRMLRALAGA